MNTSKKSLTTTLIALTFILGVIILSDTAPSLRFETQTLQQAPQDSLSQIKGKATCSCTDIHTCKPSDEVTSICSWSNKKWDYGCSGCGGPSTVKKSYGQIGTCLKNGGNDTFGCCTDECEEKGCPDKCPYTLVRKIGDCSMGGTSPAEHDEDKCKKIKCYNY